MQFGWGPIAHHVRLGSNSLPNCVTVGPMLLPNEYEWEMFDSDSAFCYEAHSVGWSLFP